MVGGVVVVASTVRSAAPTLPLTVAVMGNYWETADVLLDGGANPNQAGVAAHAAFNRQPHYDSGLLLVGDSGGMVNPFNGEGIDYAMEAANLAATVVADARSRTTDTARERVLRQYPAVLKQEHGGYFTLGRVFVKLIGDPRIMKLCTRHGLPHPTLMRITLK